MANDRKLLEEMLDHMSTRVQQNTEVVTPKEVGSDFFLHISSNPNIRKFVPQLTLRGSPMENRDVTRVYVAPTLLGCFIGYAMAEFEFLEKTSDNNDEEGYRGGWKIYALPFGAALKPNTKMVQDQKASDEHWLVTYSPATKEFIPETAGRVFYQKMELISRSKNIPQAWITMYVEVVLDEGIQFSKNIKLEKGCYRIEGPEQRHVKSWSDDKEFKAVSISKGEYQAAKNQSAALLSHKELENKPAWINW